jgi:hypothetical protein
MIHSGELAHAEVIAAVADCIFNPDAHICISRTNDLGMLLGGVIYQGFNGAGGSITMHVAGFDPHWINRDMLWACFHYPFVQLKVRSIFGQTPAKNKKALEFNRKLGFTEVYRVDEFFPNDDMIVFRMRAEECRWLKIKPRTEVDGEERASPGPA